MYRRQSCARCEPDAAVEQPRTNDSDGFVTTLTNSELASMAVTACILSRKRRVGCDANLESGIDRPNGATAAKSHTARATTAARGNRTSTWERAAATRAGPIGGRRCEPRPRLEKSDDAAGACISRLTTMAGGCNSRRTTRRDCIMPTNDEARETETMDLVVRNARLASAPEAPPVDIGICRRQDRRHSNRPGHRRAVV